MSNKTRIHSELIKQELVVMSIKSVGIIGAGAVGSYVIWGLSDVKDIKLGVIASGERNQSLRLMAV